MRWSLFFFSLMLLAAAGCGTPGAPLPPSLGIPKPVSDLQAARKGASVTLTWSAPTDTTDGELIRKPGKMKLSRSVPGNVAGSSVVADVALEPALKQDQSPSPAAKDSLTTLLGTGADFAFYSVAASSGSGKTAGPGNQAKVALVATLPAPQHIQANATATGVSVTWDQAREPENKSHLVTQYVYRIMRKQEGSNEPVAVAQAKLANAAMAFVDTGIEWQKRYEYWITPVTLWTGAGAKGEVEGDDSPVVSVFANDVFPPAAPQGLQAVFSGMTHQPFIDVTWSPNSESDLAGYNIYRHVENEAPVRMNTELVKTPSYRDSTVKAGGKYIYSVSAVDLRGNESGKSAETSETVPVD